MHFGSTSKLCSSPLTGGGVFTSKSTFTMNTKYAELHAQALRQRNFWAKERELLGTLLAPRTTWNLLKFTRLEQTTRQQMILIADAEITTEQLYHDLSLTKENH